MRLSNQPGDHYSGATCTICSRRATAMWSGVGGEIFVCQCCALDTLPRLIADAVIADVVQRLPEGVQHEMDNAFYRGLAVAAVGELRQLKSAALASLRCSR